jgi:hypothetical protein
LFREAYTVATFADGPIYTNTIADAIISLESDHSVKLDEESRSIFSDAYQIGFKQRDDVIHKWFCEGIRH